MRAYSFSEDIILNALEVIKLRRRHRTWNHHHDDLCREAAEALPIAERRHQFLLSLFQARRCRGWLH